MPAAAMVTGGALARGPERWRTISRPTGRPARIGLAGVTTTRLAGLRERAPKPRGHAAYWQQHSIKSA
ncbi:hypothetical protein ACDP63_16465 [Paracoccus sp. P2]|uniref:Uncharacterized protein n=2 Tax=Paracoccus TaxID=265 RepID=A0A7H9BVG8_PARPN|nr:hypothetical protein [Paracoccus pantotrophus]QLH15390.1 hypothetical protein HYQ43_14465 [Paracoccus pantotrophus]RDD96343.1 hypothetical protein DTW92_13145 [Paracoccus pantotrophus]RNI20591.1 hypothetical protein EB844_00750 [Paracoccus pantotrophus]WGR65524.1 hypothetical protein E3U24_09780 [Paracoccus pantotrophus]